MAVGSAPDKARCPVCLGQKKRFIETYKDYTLYLCEACDLVFADPMMTDKAFYSTDADYALRDAVVVDSLEWDFRWDINEFLKHHPIGKGNLLDIGCGTGFFVKKASDLGFNAYGIDFSERAIERGREHFKLDTLYATSCEGLRRKFPDMKFHVVTMFHILEHLENPNEVMSQIHELLHRDSVVVILLPFRDRWPDILGESVDYPPHHLTRWSLKAVEHFLDRNGFYIRRCKVENFPLQDMRGLVYKYALKFAPFLTMRGKGGEAAKQEASPEKEQELLKRRRVKMALVMALSFPLWLLLKLIGARGPLFYIEASPKPHPNA
ncbi:MAG: class I SAM-dependent methyltransferase [Thermodesulfovibrionales bacterium]|nr:class I SAM-dependent methyltransferase [Thermodesulfovibrionales bacterium]